MKRIILAISMLTLSVHAGPDESSDVVVYGGSPSGLSAAVQAARLGSRVVVVEPYLKIGGMMAAGLTRTDLGDAATTGGLCREFFERLAEYYDLLGIKRERYYDFEPHVAGIIWSKMLEETGRIEVLEHTRLTAVDKDGSALRAIQVRTQDGRTLRIAGKVFIDATYEGDLAAMAGAPYRVGREAKAEFGEPNGQEEADKLLQAYCFRLTVTDDPGNLVPISKPDGYDPKEFGLLAKYVNEKNIVRFAPDCLYAREKTQGKADGNAQWHCWVSTDWASFHHDYPEGSWERRQEIYDEYKRRTLSWFYFLQHDPSVPEALRNDALRWGLPRDEHQETDHVPFMLYIREARRIMGDYVFTEFDATKNTVKPDSIGCGGYPIDSHHVTDYQAGILHLERPPGNIQIPVRKGYQIPYRILLPRKVDQLLVSLCVSSTHLGYCSLRMEPEYIKMGQAAGTAAHLAHTGDTSPREIDVGRLQDTLRKAGAILGK
jgi:hypothetical protein